jgi:hypothetical protein
MKYFGARGTMIYEKYLSSKSRVRLSLMHVLLYKMCMYAYNTFAFLLISLLLQV